MSTDASRGEIWVFDPDPVTGHEQGGRRPGLVISSDRLNESPAGLLWIIPMTTRDKGIRTHYVLNPPEGGTSRRSLIMCEQLRCVSEVRLVRRMGTVSSKALGDILEIIAELLDLNA